MLPEKKYSINHSLHTVVISFNSSLINFLHLLRSVAFTLFSCRLWQFFLHNPIPGFLNGLKPLTNDDQKIFNVMPRHDLRPQMHGMHSHWKAWNKHNQQKTTSPLSQKSKTKVALPKSQNEKYTLHIYVKRYFLCKLRNKSSIGQHV